MYIYRYIYMCVCVCVWKCKNGKKPDSIEN